jgi:hypothetical protein
MCSDNPSDTWNFDLVILRLHTLVDLCTFIQDLQHVLALIRPASGKNTT